MMKLNELENYKVVSSREYTGAGTIWEEIIVEVDGEELKFIRRKGKGAGCFWTDFEGGYPAKGLFA